MKKIKILFVMLSICVFILCGCDDSNNNSYDAEKTSHSTTSPKKETEISSFSTELLDKTPNRVNNIAITCSKINETIIKNGDTFSFCNAVGEVNDSTGYKEADMFDAKGNIFKGYGGGTCQVSSTLYNAVLNINGIEIIERHAHSKRVYYVEKDKDAAIDVPSKLDFKFKNNTGNDIKIYASNTDKEVTMKIMKME